MNSSPFATPLRQAAARLLRTPAFTSVVVVMIGVAIAALLTIGTAVSALLWRPLPYPHADRLVLVEGFATQMQASIGFAPGLLEDLAVMPQVEAIGGYDYRPSLYDGEGFAFSNAQIEPRLVEMLGGTPLLGRMFVADDDGDVAVLSEPVWRSRFGADPDVVGRSIDFDGTPLRVIGVMADSFRFPQRDTALWRPMRLTPAQLHGADAFHFGAVQTVVRLAPGLAATEFEAALNVAASNRPELEPMRQHMGLSLRVTSLRQRWDSGRSSLLGLLAAAAGAVLLLLLANVGSLWLARCLQRARELAVRSALGASPRRMALELICEVLLVCSGAAILGLLAVPPGLRGLEWLGVLDQTTPLLPALGLPTVIAAAATTLLMIALLSLVPIWIARHPQSLSLMGQGMRSAGPARSAQLARRTLVVIQIALAVSLLGGAGLLTRSLWQLLDQDVGFQPENVVLVMVESRNRHTSPQDDGSARLATMQAALAAIPGVEHISVADAPPFSFSESVSSVKLEGDGATRDVSIRDRVIGTNYFAALGMPIARGRDFRSEDHSEAEPGVIVDERFVAQHLAGKEALGTRVGLAVGRDGAETRWGRIVGVVPQVRHAQVEEESEQGTLYRFSPTPSLDHHGDAILVLRTSLALGDLGQRAREAASATGQRAVDVASMSQRMHETLSHRIPLMGLVGAFAVLGAALAGIGLFALVAFSVQRRMAEFGLRLALGAPPSSLKRLAMREGLHAAVPGLALGLLGALAAGRLLAARLYQVSPTDPLTLTLVLVAVLLLVLLACVGPARRAAALDPITTLRHE